MTPGIPHTSIDSRTIGHRNLYSWDPIDPTLFTCESLSKYSDGNPMICLLGRIESAYDFMYSEIPGAISHNVKFNNNIVTRNTSLVPLTGSKPGKIFGGSASVLVRNYHAVASTMSIHFGALGADDIAFGNLGAVEVTLGDDFRAEWAWGGYQGQRR